MSAPSFFKKNEKVMMVVLLVIIAPLFAFTGIVSMVVSAQRDVQFAFHGEEVYYDEIVDFQNKMNTLTAINNVRSFGSMRSVDGSPRFRFTVTSLEAAENFLLLYREAKRLGIQVSTEDRNQYIRDMAKGLIVQYSFWENNKEFDAQANSETLQKAMETATFDSRAYERLMKDRNFIADISIKYFEECVSDVLTAQKVLEVATRGVTVSTKEVFELFSSQNPRLGFEFIKVEITPFEKLVDPASLTVAEKKAAYEQNVSKFLEPSKVSFDAAVFDVSAIQASDELLQAHYEEIREFRGEEFRVTAIDSGESTFKALAEVREIVLDDYRSSVAGKVIEAALDRAKELKTKGEEYELKDAFEEADLINIKFVNSGLFSRSDYSQVPTIVQNIGQLNTIHNGLGALAVGDLSRFMVPFSSGPFFYRISEKVNSKNISFEDADPALLTELAIRIRAVELATDKVASLRKRIIGVEDTDGDLAEENKEKETATEDTAATGDSSDFKWEDLEKIENYTIHKVEPISLREVNNIKADGVRLPRGYVLFNAVRQLAEVGEITEPLNAGFQPQDIYLAKFIERRDPDSAGFKAQETRLRQQLLQTKEREITERLVSNLTNYKTYPKGSQPK